MSKLTDTQTKVPTDAESSAQTKPSLKIKWKVVPVDKSRSGWGHKREWPRAFYNNKKGSLAATISCDDRYHIDTAKSGEHGPLTLRIADYSGSQGAFETWEYRTIKRRLATLEEAKAVVAAVLAQHPEWLPKSE